MHETSLMENILKTAEASLAEYNVEKVNELTVIVGRLANVIPDSLEFAFEAFSGKTICKGAKLTLKSVPIEGLCTDCGQVFFSTDIPLICPGCHGRMIEITGGTEVYLESIDFDEADGEEKKSKQKK